MKKSHKNALVLSGVFLAGVMLSVTAKEYLIKIPFVGKYFI